MNFHTDKEANFLGKLASFRKICTYNALEWRV